MIPCSVTDRRVAPATLGVFAWAVLACLVMPRLALAETPAEACHRLAGDAVPLDSIDGPDAISACSAAVTAAPQDKQLQYEYARALERSAQRDQARQIYQWIAQDGYAPATAALARMAGPLTGEAAEREKMAGQYDAIAAIAARIAKSIPRDHDDPNTVLAQTGKDPAKILAWVKANTRIVPYAGMLRGASGVLMDRSGNSLDRALFLADLLHRAGYNVRIARGEIPQAAAEALRARFVTSAPKSVAPVAPDKAALLKVIGSDPRLDPKLVEKAVDETIAGAQKFNADVLSLYGKVLPAVLQAVGNDPARDARLAADADVVLRDHFWVQRQDGSAWGDLDPDADLVGKQTAAATFAPSETPVSLKHRVTLRLTVETLSNGKLGETKLLEQSWLPSELAGKSITIGHALFPQQDIDAILKDKDPQVALIGAITDASVVMPTLQVGAKLTSGQLYDFNGQVEAPTPINLASMGGTAIISGNKLASGIASAFGDSAPAAQALSPSKTIVTAEWLEIDVIVPGKPVEKHRRAIFDLIGAAERANPASIAAPAITDDLRKQRALALSASIDAYVFDATPSSEWIQRVSTDGTAQVLTQAAEIARTAQSFADVPAPSADHIEPQLWGWAKNRVASVEQSRSAPTAPNVALLWETPSPKADAPDNVEIEFDIVTNGTASDTNFAHRVAQGVMDTIMEHAILRGRVTDANAAVQHASDIAAGRKWIVLKPTASPGADQSLAPTKARPLIASALASGYVVITPNSADGANLQQTAWWQVDEVTGQTVGVGENGRGSAMVEAGQIIRVIVSTARVWRVLGCAVAGVYSIAADQGEISLRTKGEGFACVAYSLLSPAGGFSQTAQELLAGLIWTVATTPVGGGEGGER